MQFHHSTPPQNVRIRRIPTITNHRMKHPQRNCMRNCEAGAEACCGTRGWRHGQIPRKVARNSIEQSFNIVRKRCNSNDLNSMYERVAGELRAKLGAVSAMRQVRSGRDTCAVATGPGRATSGRPTLQTSSNQRNSNRLTRTPVTNVVNPSQKTSIFSEKALGLTTFVTTRTKPHASDTAPLVWRAPEGTSGPGRGAGGRRRGLAGHTRTTGTAGVEGAGGSGGHGRASRRGTERSEGA